MAEALAITLFAAGYLAITMEHRLFVNKAAASLLLAVLLWIVASFALPLDLIREALMVAGNDIFGLLIFLLSAMTLVEILVHYHLFDVVEHYLRSRGWTLYHLGWALTGLTFVLSAFLANLTVTIVAIQIARRLFPKETLLGIGALIVIASNAGGAFSPVGDVTTLMLWFAHKFTASEVIIQGIIPSIAITLIPAFLILKPLKQFSTKAVKESRLFHPSRSDKAIMVAIMGSFLLPLAASYVNLPPYMGLLAGLGFVWILIDLAKRARPQETHLGADIRKFLQQTDIECLQFFVGILLAVSALHALGILDTMTEWLLSTTPSIARIISAFVSLGIGSAIVDNVPLTAAAISTLEGISSTLWVLLAITVGTGGSLLIIGSASGVIAMGMLKELTFGRYLKIAGLPALLGYIGGFLVWSAQYVAFF